jgi:hypothetical protein
VLGRLHKKTFLWSAQEKGWSGRHHLQDCRASLHFSVGDHDRSAQLDSIPLRDFFPSTNYEAVPSFMKHLALAQKLKLQCITYTTPTSARRFFVPTVQSLVNSTP